MSAASSTEIAIVTGSFVAVSPFVCYVYVRCFRPNGFEGKIEEISLAAAEADEDEEHERTSTVRTSGSKVLSTTSPGTMRRDVDASKQISYSGRESGASSIA